MPGHGGKELFTAFHFALDSMARPARMVPKVRERLARYNMTPLKVFWFVFAFVYVMI